MRKLLAFLTCLATLGGYLAFAAVSQAQDNRPCSNDSERCMIAAATTYLDALVSHDATHIRLAPNVRRTEQGNDTGDGAAAIRKSLTPPTPDQIIIDKRDVRWFVDQDQHEAVAFYLLDIGATIPPTTHAGTVHLSERFKVVRGLITQIEAIFTVGAGPDEGSGWPALVHH
jgi:hypothetical protein